MIYMYMNSVQGSAQTDLSELDPLPRAFNFDDQFHMRESSYPHMEMIVKIKNARERCRLIVCVCVCVRERERERERESERAS